MRAEGEVREAYQFANRMAEELEEKMSTTPQWMERYRLQYSFWKQEEECLRWVLHEPRGSLEPLIRAPGEL